MVLSGFIFHALFHATGLSSFPAGDAQLWSPLSMNHVAFLVCLVKQKSQQNMLLTCLVCCPRALGALPRRPGSSIVPHNSPQGRLFSIPGLSSGPSVPPIMMAHARPRALFAACYLLRHIWSWKVAMPPVPMTTGRATRPAHPPVMPPDPLSTFYSSFGRNRAKSLVSWRLQAAS